MKNMIRFLIVIALVAGSVLLARNNTAWASASDEGTSLVASGGVGAVVQPKKKKHHDEDHRTVKPPHGRRKECQDGQYAVGGIATFSVEDLKEGYCIEWETKEHGFALGRLPKHAGKFLTNFVFQRIYLNRHLQYKLPPDNGNIQTCFAVPPNKQVTIYFLDFFGARFEKRRGQISWVPVETTIVDGLACANTDTSGVYALVRK